MTQYEQLIEFIINEQEDKARELFHQIVVEKSREIYENLIDETDFTEEGKSQDQVEDLVDEIEVDKEGIPEAEEEELGGDEPADDAEMDADEEGEEAGEEEGELEDRVMDLETALDELKAEFDKLMADEADEPEHADMFGGKEEPMAMEDNGTLREYVEQVGGNDYTKFGKSGDNGANAKSVVAGKNDMGGTTANIVKGGAEAAADGKATPAPNNQYAKGKGNLPGAGSFENVPGANTKGYVHKVSAKKGE